MYTLIIKDCGQGHVLNSEQFEKLTQVYVKLNQLFKQAQPEHHLGEYLTFVEFLTWWRTHQPPEEHVAEATLNNQEGIGIFQFMIQEN
ncbi:MAG: hypothetical protein SVR94_02905 [Pseudomonadota bacterium]|nr:hypothetical protein [Pseudomonadota bacterium]